MFQGNLDDINTIEQAAHISYKDMEHLEFQIMLTNNYYTNPNSMHVCFLMKIEKATDNDTDIEPDLITVNNFIAHLIQEIGITHSGNDKQLMPTFSPYEIYQYSDAMLKYLPEKSPEKTSKNNVI